MSSSKPTRTLAKRNNLRVPMASTQTVQFDSTYPYSDGILPARHIRLLDLFPGKGDDTVKCSFRAVDLDEGCSYEALSYCWGADYRTSNVLISGHLVSIGVNLHEALQQIRLESQTRTIWADALCINQSDTTEKTSQVNMMGEIYKKCSRCLIWLGKLPADSQDFVAADAAAIFELIKLMATAEDDAQDLELPASLSSPELQARAGKALRDQLFDTVSWWRRIWTVQEAVIPASADVIWGPLVSTWATFSAASENWLSGRASRVMDRLGIKPNSYNINVFCGLVQGISITRSSETILSLFNRWRYRGAKDPRDKVYALFGVLQHVYGIDDALPSVKSTDYTLDASVLYTRVTKDLLRSCSPSGGHSLVPLVGRKGEPTITAGLPSWVIDWVPPANYADRASAFYFHSSRYNTFGAGGKTTLDLDFLEDDKVLSLQGVRVGRVVAIGDILKMDVHTEWPVPPVTNTARSWRQLLRLGGFEDYVGGGSFENAFWRTLLGDCIVGEFVDRRAEDSDRVHFDDLLDRNQSNNLWGSFRSMVVNQAFFQTDSGYIGIGPQTCCLGDEAWIFLGGNVPFLLRPNQGTSSLSATEIRREFLGDGYVHGVMDGEALRNEYAIETVLLV